MQWVPRRLAGLVLLAIGSTALVSLGPQASAAPATETFSFAGAVTQPFPVPAGVCQITIDAIGAAGGDGNADGPLGTGANGGRVTATAAVSPGETLDVGAGGAGGDGPETGAAGSAGVPDGGTGGDGGTNAGGGGGGGSSAVLRGSSPLVIAAGGGGGGGGGQTSGQGDGGAGGETGEDGLDVPNGAQGGLAGGNGGAGGAGVGAGGSGSSGGALNGGDGGDSPDNNQGGGGGGGGAVGGGGGGASSANNTNGGGGGGGGSSLGPAGATFQTGVAGDASGNGVVVITYDAASGEGCPPTPPIPPGAGERPAAAITARPAFTG